MSDSPKAIRLKNDTNKHTMTIHPLVPSDEFPIFKQKIHGQPLTYLDSAATTQKPKSVIDAEIDFYRTANANVHRGIHTLAERATEQFEAARATVAKFVGGESNEIVFTKGATEAINLVASSFVRPRIKPGMQIIVTITEHHSNFVPWQQLAKEIDAKLTVVPLKSSSAVIASTVPTRRDRTKQSREIATTRQVESRNDNPWKIDLEFLEKALKERPTAVVAVTDVSNVLGTVNPTAKIIELAHRYNAPVLVDAAQSLAHLPVNVRRLDADFLVGSAHKIYGPTGIGFLWGKTEHLNTMAPYQFGGDMIRSVSVKESSWNDVPWKFEAGTPNIAGAIGFGASLDFISQLGWEPIANHEEALLAYADHELRTIEGLTVLGPTSPRDRAGLFSFTVDGIHPHDLATILDEHGVAIRAGHHCAQPLHESLGHTASARASFGVYNGSDDVDRLVASIQPAQKTFAR